MANMIVDTRTKTYMKVRKEGNTFIRERKQGNQNDIKTQYQFRDLNEKEYNIYITKAGKAYIIKETANGTLNKVYLPKDIAEQIIAETKQVKPNMIVDN